MALRVAVAEWSAGEELDVRGGHLMQGEGIVEGCDRDVSTVEDQRP